MSFFSESEVQNSKIKKIIGRDVNKDIDLETEKKDYLSLLNNPFPISRPNYYR